MKSFFKSKAGLLSLVSLGVGVAAMFQFSATGFETQSQPKFHVEDTPISRDGHGETSYAPIVKKSRPECGEHLFYAHHSQSADGASFF